MPGKKKINVEKDTLDHSSLKQAIHTWFGAHSRDIEDEFIVSTKRMKEL
jgi:hypothetical protein